MKKIILALFSFFAFFSLSAQLQDGAIAPDFTVTDLDGNVYNLYDVLSEGKTVLLDVSATWCGPCWSYHNNGILKDFTAAYGPDGSNEALVLMIEDDRSTTLADLNGTGTNTLGDWVTGTNYPIVDSQDGVFNTKYSIAYFPTIYMICPDRIITQIGQAGTIGAFESHMGGCPSIETKPTPRFLADRSSGCNELEVNFEDDSWPRSESWFWDFGDGNTSTDQHPIHTYTAMGDYDVTLNVANQFGEAESITQDAITIGDGVEIEGVNTGLASNLEAGSTGGFFEGGHQGMIFDALSDFVLSSATVYSDRAATRTFVVLDDNQNLVVKRDVFIEEGEHRIALNMTIPQGQNYRIGMWSDANLYRNNSGVSYPYIVDNLVNIKTSTVTTTTVDPNDYYYYLYDWEVKEIGCNPSVSTVDVELDPFKLFPNPAFDRLTVEINDAKFSQLQVLDITGRVLDLPSVTNLNSIIINVEALNPGLYVINLDGKTQKFYKQ